jgi:hypothetical protein
MTVVKGLKGRLFITWKWRQSGGKLGTMDSLTSALRVNDDGTPDQDRVVAADPEGHGQHLAPTPVERDWPLELEVP